MFITKQHNGELNDFIKNRSRYRIKFDYSNLGEVQEIVKWCKENFQGDGAGQFMSRDPNRISNISITWHMVDELDFIAFKLRWA